MKCKNCGKIFERLNQGDYEECNLGDLCNKCADKATFVRQWNKAKHELVELSAVWERIQDGYSDDLETALDLKFNYPKYLPSFDEFVNDFLCLIDDFGNLEKHTKE